MKTFRKGERINIIGPLGNGFTLPPRTSSAPLVLIGGGVGIVSLYPLAEAINPPKLFVFIGGKTEKDILCVEDFQQLKSHLLIATEDGSRGFKGTVVDLFWSQKDGLFKGDSYYAYACGPMPMLKALSKLNKDKNVIFQVSLESRMGCGFGACWSCVVKTKHPQTPYQRVCKEGPTFYSKDIAWE